MGDVHGTQLIKSNFRKNSFVFPKLSSSDLHSFVSNFQNKVSECVEVSTSFFKLNQ